MLASTRRRARPARVALRRGARAHRDRAARRRPLGLLPGRSRRGRASASVSTAARAVVRRPHPAAEGRRPRGALPRRARRSRGDAARGRRPERPRRRRRAGPRARRSRDELGVAGQRALRAAAAAHERLADYYRAADVCIVPSRAESFGLVALEAAACGTPVVAAVGRRSALARRRRRRPASSSTIAIPADYAAPVAMLLDEIPSSRRRWARSRSARSRKYSWSITAARLRRLYGDLVARGLVRCD